MRFTVAVIVIAAAWAAFHSNVRAGQEPAAQTMGSGIYTETQAKRGELIEPPRPQSPRPQAGCQLLIPMKASPVLE